MISFELYEIFLDKEFYNIYKDNQMIKPELAKVIIARTTEQIRIICREEINEELLSSGTYTLKYIDSYDQVVDNFKPITDFTI